MVISCYIMLWCYIILLCDVNCWFPKAYSVVPPWWTRTWVVHELLRGAYRNQRTTQRSTQDLLKIFRYSVFWSYGQLWHIFLHVSWIQISRVHLMFPSFGPCAQPQGMIGVLAYSVFSEAGSQRGAGFCWFCFHSAPGSLQAPHVALQQLGHLTSQLATGHWGTIGYP